MYNFLHIIFAILVILSLLEWLPLGKNLKLVIYFFIFLTLVFIAGVRQGDVDYVTYQKNFYNVTDWTEEGGVIKRENRMEVGFLTLNKIFKALGIGFQPLIAFVALSSITCCFIFFKKYTPYILVAALLYFSHVFILRDMLQIRAGLSISISMFAIPYITQRNLKKTLFILGIASLFHFVGFLLILVYISYPYINSTKSQVLLLCLGLILGLVLNMSFFSFLLTIFNHPLLLIYVSAKQYSYSLGLLNPVLIKHYIVLAVLIYNRQFFEENVPHFRVLLLSYIIAAFWLSSFNAFAIFAGRIGTLFSNVEHVIIPSLLLIRRFQFITLMLIIAYCCIAFFSKQKELNQLEFFFLN